MVEFYCISITFLYINLYNKNIHAICHKLLAFHVYLKCKLGKTILFASPEECYYHEPQEQQKVKKKTDMDAEELINLREINLAFYCYTAIKMHL